MQGGTILTRESRFERGNVVVDRGKILAVGRSPRVAKGTEIFDASGKYVIPGLVEAHCHVSLFADGIDARYYDGNEMTDPVTPHLRAIDAIHPEDLAFADLRRAGITTINTSPGSANIVGGQTAIVKTAGRTVEEMLVRAPAALKMALGENPKRVYGEQKKAPSTRMGSAGVLREAVAKAERYIERKTRHEEKVAAFHKGTKSAQRPEPFERDVRLEILASALSREIPTHIHAHRADDIMTAIRIAEEFHLDLVLIHATEGYKIADILAEKGIPCIPGPVLFSRMKLELRGLTPRNVGLLSRAGVKVAIQTDEGSATRYLTLNAALAVNEGMDETEALRAITLTPAEILRIDDRVGSLEPGKDADLAVLTAHPFDIAQCRTERVLIDGRTVYDGDAEG
ncbi:MAG: amidohydrolase [Candidatus Bipolaricaulota bacterium]|nr:amidohydrolase [Candidatus Bipolaricaulota bacterium]